MEEQNVLWSQKRKIEIFGHNNNLYVWRSEGETLNLRTLSSTVVVASRSGLVSLPAGIVMMEDSTSQFLNFT